MTRPNPLLAAALLLMLTPAAAAPPAEAGCSARPDVRPGDADWVAFLDGELQPPGTVQPEVARADLLSAHMICWRAVERLHDLRVSHGAWNVFTRSGPTAAFHAGLEALVEHQDRHYATHRRYASNLQTLAGYEAPPHTTMELRGTAAGWTVEVRHRMVPEVCYIYAGAVGQPREGLEQRTPRCYSEDPHHLP